jgi:DNA-binding transcriptional LysR family regulator
MDRHEIDTFLTLAEELHFGRTAQRLGLSQARVSQTVKALERRIGAPLFARSTRRVVLTPIGQRLRDDIEPAHRQIRDAVNRATSVARGIDGVFRVGFMGPVAGELIVNVRSVFRVEYPGCEVEIQETQIADPCRPVRDGAVDVVLTQLPVKEPGLTQGAVAIREPKVLAVSSRHPFARQTSVSLEDLARDRTFQPAGTPSEDWKQSHTPWHTPSGRAIERGVAVTTFQELLTFIAAGEGICAVAAHNRQYHARPDIRYISFRDSPPFEFGPVWRAAGETVLVRAFVRAIGDFVQARGGPDAVAVTSDGTDVVVIDGCWPLPVRSH